MNHKLAIVLLAILALAVATPAQVIPVPGTGCGNAVTQVQGTPTLGQRVSVTNPFPCFLTTPITVIGLPTVIPWRGCSNQPCPVGVIPVLSTIGGIVNSTILVIPNDPALIGICVRAQSGCYTSTCIQLDRAVDICVR